MKCIWCLKSDPEVTFKREAHVIPQSLGGKRICKEVCDFCNHYFGARTKNAPAIEVALKEALNISRFFILQENKANL